MTKSVLALTLAAALVLGGAAFALERGLALARTRGEREAAAAELDAALKLAARHPEAFGSPAASADSPLKAMAQDLAARHGLALGFLSESERDADGGRRERHVVLRLVHPAHRNLVLFLGELEARGGRVREIHVRPSTSKADHYEEAEAVVVRVLPAEAP